MTISIHAPRAGSDVSLRRPRPLIGISIHAPRAGSDLSPISPAPPPRYFNPRSPCGERLAFPLAGASAFLISIHAPRAGSDSGGLLPQSGRLYFNPRSPCGERLGTCVITPCPSLFQSTLPVRGATAAARTVVRTALISIHAPRAGSDVPYHVALGLIYVISIHAPRAGSDLSLTAWAE